jgi:hypothetical protein
MPGPAALAHIVVVDVGAVPAVAAGPTAAQTEG